MKNVNVLNNISRGLHNFGFQIKKHSPAILVGAGVIGVVASAVMACKATTKIPLILDEKERQIQHVKDVMSNQEIVESGKYTETDAANDLKKINAQAGMQFVKLYAPSVLLGTVSIVSILASHNILNKRNVALASAYSVVDTSFKNYRKRVVDRFGKEVDHELRYNIKAEKIETVDIDENGKETKNTEVVKVSDSELDQYSEYSRFFDETNPLYQKDAEYNKMFLKRQEQYANDKLKAQGHLFLNEVYEMLGFEITKAGQVVGWIYDKDNPNGDNYVDFGIYDLNKRRAMDFVNGYEKAILLDFNVDGNIWDLMK